MSAQDYDDIIKPVVQFVSTAYTIRYNVKWLRWMLCIIYIFDICIITVI